MTSGARDSGLSLHHGAVGTVDEILDNISDGFAAYDREWRFTFINRAAEAFLGRPRAELLGKVLWEEFPRLVGSVPEAEYRRAMATGQPVDFETVSPTFGRRVVVRALPSPYGLTAYFRDETEKQQALEALRASDARHRALFEHNLDGLFLTEPDGRVLAANPAACRMLGLTEQEIIARGRAGIVDVSDPRLADAIEQRKRTGSARGEMRLIRKDGSTFEVEVASAVFVDAEGKERTSTSFRDLTDRKRAENVLRLTAEIGAALAGALDEGAIGESLTQLLVPTLADVCAIDLLEGDRLRRVRAAPHDRDVLLGRSAERSRMPALDRVIRQGQPMLVREVTPDWLEAATTDPEQLAAALALRPRSLVLVPLSTRDRVLGVLWLARVDASGRYGPDDVAIATAIADRAALAIHSARLHEATLEAKRLRDEVLGIVAHDLRGPLSTITLTASLIARRPDVPETQLILRAASRADLLIQDLLTVAMIDAGTLPITRGRELAAALLSEVTDIYAPLAQEKGVRLTTSLEAPELTASVDRHRVVQMLSNLVSNAVKFTSEGGNITLSARAGDGAVVLAVTDTGCGIGPEQLAHVFDRFWQGARAHRGGAGLGLAIARGVAMAHGGTIDVESTVGQGTSFTVTLPTAGD